MVQLIREITETHGEVRIGELDAIIYERDPIFSPKRYGSGSLSALLKQMGGFTLTPVKGNTVHLTILIAVLTRRQEKPWSTLQD
jgi:hypothetical protein